MLTTNLNGWASLPGRAMICEDYVKEGFIMTTVEATSEVFMTAFRALPKKAREAVIEKMLSDKEFLEDIIDATIIEQRRKEPSRPLEEYLSDRRQKG